MRTSPRTVRCNPCCKSRLLIPLMKVTGVTIQQKEQKIFWIQTLPKIQNQFSACQGVIVFAVPFFAINLQHAILGRATCSNGPTCTQDIQMQYWKAQKVLIASYFIYKVKKRGNTNYQSLESVIFWSVMYNLNHIFSLPVERSSRHMIPWYQKSGHLWANLWANLLQMPFTQKWILKQYIGESHTFRLFR